MLHIGEALGRFLWLGGVPGRLLLALGLAGLALSIASSALAAVPSWRGSARRVGGITLLVAAGTMGLAAAMTWAKRAEADRAAEAADLAPRRERIRRDGYTEARVASLGGLLLGVFPLISGVAALMAASAQARLREAKTPAARAGRAAPRRGALSSPAAIGPAGAAIAAAIAAAMSAKAEIPGRDLDKPAWEVLEHEAMIEAGRLEEGCAGLDRDLRSLGRAEAAPIARDLGKLEEACARSREGRGTQAP